MLAHRLLHSLNKHKKGKKEKISVKLDMSKAYNRVEWPFIKVVMKALGFGDGQIWLVSSYISSFRYSLLMNGQPGKNFTLSRGLRQRDHLSPYLFFMCAKSFSSLIINVKRNDEVQGMLVAKGVTSINHLLFADDSILFCKASKEKWYRIQNIVIIYEKASGQTINKQKSSLFFSSNTPSSFKQEILQ